MATVDLYPAVGRSVPVPTATDSACPTSGYAAVLPLSDYLQARVDRGDLLTYDPLDAGTTPTRDDFAYAIYVTDLATRNGSYGGEVVDVVGYNAATQGRGGEGQYWWDATSTATQDYGTVAGTLTTGRWKRVVTSGYLDPAWFGAYGDGSTDDTTALRACIAALSSSAYKGIDFGARHYHLGTRTGASDAALRLTLSGLSDKQLFSSGAKFSFQTTNQVSGYSPVLFKIKTCTNVSFVGKWFFEDTKSWGIYATHGGTGTSPAADSTLFSGMYAIEVLEGCSNITFGALSFKKCRYGLCISTDGEIGAGVPTGTDRTSMVTVDSIYADDVEYPCGAFENGDHLTVKSLTTKNCFRPFFVYGVDSFAADVTIRNTITGFKSSVARKQRDTTNVTLKVRYVSDDGYPGPVLQYSLEPVTGTGDPFIRGVNLDLACTINGTIVAGSANAPVKFATAVPSSDGSYTESDFTTQSVGMIDGIVARVDKGKFEHYLAASGGSSALRKIPITFTPVYSIGQTGGGAVNVPIVGINSTLYDYAKKFQFLKPHVYEFYSSDTVHEASVTYPISGWAAWKDAATANVSLTNHTMAWRWTRIGALVHYEMLLTIGSGTIPAGAWYFMPPYYPAVEGGSYVVQQEIGDVLIKDASTGDLYRGFLQYTGASNYPQIILRVKDAAGVITHISTPVTSTAPMTFASGDTIRICVSYNAYQSF